MTSGRVFPSSRFRLWSGRDHLLLFLHLSTFPRRLGPRLLISNSSSNTNSSYFINIIGKRRIVRGHCRRSSNNPFLLPPSPPHLPRLRNPQLPLQSRRGDPISPTSSPTSVDAWPADEDLREPHPQLPKHRRIKSRTGSQPPRDLRMEERQPEIEI